MRKVPQKKPFVDSFIEFFEKAFKIHKYTDPVEILPKKALDIIFSQFSGSELLKLTLVNRKWYRYIGTSKECMNKIRVRISEANYEMYKIFNIKDSNILTQAGRQYVHITLKSVNRSLQACHKLLLLAFPWKTVQLIDHVFKYKTDFLDFLGTIEPHIEELALVNIKYGLTGNIPVQTNFYFPNLKTLNIVNCYSFIYGDAFKQLTDLKCLNLSTEPLPEHFTKKDDKIYERSRYIQRMLLNNRDISYLELFLHQDEFDTIFSDYVFMSKFAPSLQSFCVGKFAQTDGNRVNVLQMKNFVEFLKRQENCLATLYLDNWLGNATLEYAVNDMNLKSLSIANLETYGRHNDSLGHLNLYSNDTIEHLSIWTESAKHVYLTNETIKVCRALRVLEIRTVNQTILETIFEFNDDIEVIICDFFTAYIPPERRDLPNLKRVVINVTCQDNFRDLIAYKDCYTNFEAVFLHGANELQKRREWGLRNFYHNY